MGCGERGDGDGWPGEGRWDVALCGLTPAHDMRGAGVHCEVG